MASWIKFDTTTPDKPEVWQIASDLGIDPDAVVGKLLRVWAWFDLHSENGNAPSVTKVTLDRHVGNAGFCDAMVSAGWLLESGKTISLPNFERHNGETAKKRALTAQRVAKHKRSTNAEGNAKVTPTELPKEDKKREDKDQKHSPSDSSPADAGDPQSAEIVELADQPKVPYREFVDLYNRVCSEHFPQVAKITDTRRKRIAKLWKTEVRSDNPKLRTDTLDYWRRYFEHCLTVAFFTAERNGTGHDSWRPDFDFLISERGYVGVLEGRYV